MNQVTHCPQCNAELPPGAPAGLCPKCLLLAGFESGAPGSAASPGTAQTDPSPAAPASGFIPPKPEELAQRFPQLEVLELLGKGGMGAVYKARQPGLDRFVALKILPPEVGGDPAFAERFTREARALAKLSHPHIVAVYDFGQTEGLYYFIMEFVDGVNLRQAIRGGTLAATDALAIVPQICDALQFAHDEGVVHRDIKPENILVDKRGRVKIADFGLAKLVGGDEEKAALTGTYQVMGTPRYMAPEQMEGSKAVDHRADIYSLGVVFYELLTGELPLGRFAPPSKKVHIDVRIDEVVLRALEKEPEQRYQHASDVSLELNAIRSSAGVTSSATVPDHVVFRRLTPMVLVAITLCEAAFIALQAGYLTGADWYFKKELPYSYLNTLLMALMAGCAYLGGYWWYLLAKDPRTPRSLEGFFKQLQTPDPRVWPLWLPMGVLIGVWGVGTFLAVTFASDFVATVIMSSAFVIGPYLAMALLAGVYRRPVQVSGVSRPAASRRPSSPAAGNHSAAAVALPQMLAVALGLILGLICCTIGLLFIPAAFLFAEVGSGPFWGCMGAALGCVGGGLGSLAGSWNTYRQLRGEIDWLKSTAWTPFDTGLALYGSVGMVLLFMPPLLAALGAFSGVESTVVWNCFHGAWLMGGLMVFQAALFLIYRSGYLAEGRERLAVGDAQAADHGVLRPAGKSLLWLLTLAALVVFLSYDSHSTVSGPAADAAATPVNSVITTIGAIDPWYTYKSTTSQNAEVAAAGSASGVRFGSSSSVNALTWSFFAFAVALLASGAAWRMEREDKKKVPVSASWWKSYWGGSGLFTALYFVVVLLLSGWKAVHSIPAVPSDQPKHAASLQEGNPPPDRLQPINP